MEEQKKIKLVVNFHFFFAILHFCIFAFSRKNVKMQILQQDSIANIPFSTAFIEHIIPNKSFNKYSASKKHSFLESE